MYLDGIKLIEIATKHHICIPTIDNIVNAAGIPRDRCKQSRKYDRDFVCRLYEEGKTTREIAVQIGGSRSSIAYIIKQAGVSRERKIRDHILADRAKKCLPLTEDFISYLDGLLISDGHLTKSSKHSLTAAYRQSCVKKDWLEQIAGNFAEQNIQTLISEEIRNGEFCGYCINSLRYDQLYFQRKRWYNDNNVKIVPNDIDFSTDFLLNWVYGDGTRVKTTLRLCCDSFLEKEVDELQDKLRNMGFGFKKISMGLDSKGTVKWRLSICKRDGLLDFFKLLGKPNVRSFSYKWPKEIMES